MNRIKERILKKSNLWHLGAIVLFIVVASVYFAPAFKGYILKQPDIVNYIGMSREVQDFRDNSGEQVQWTNSMFSGMAATQISMKYPNTWLAESTKDFLRFGFPSPVFFLIIYFFGFYVLALSLRLKPLVGILGALAFGLSSYSIIILEAGHNSKASAIGFAAYMLAGFIMAYRWKNWILGVGLSSLFFMVELYANHVQITYYMAFILILIGLAELIRYARKGELAKFGKITGLLLVGYVAGILVNYGNIAGTAEYAKETIRGGTELTIDANGESMEGIKTSGLDRAYITNWSLGIDESFSLLVPNYKGGKSQYILSNEKSDDWMDDVEPGLRPNVAQSSQYWGDQPFTSGPVYLGIIVVFFAFLALVYVRSNYKWALLSATLLALALSWGKNYVSAFILLPILLYNVNMFLDNKKQLYFSIGNTVLFVIALAAGGSLISISLTDFFLDFVPGYDKFRAVTIVLTVVEVTVPLLGVLFLQHLFKEKERIKQNLLPFAVISGLFLGFFLILLAAPTSFNTFLSGQELAAMDGIENPQMLMQYESFFDELESVRMNIFKDDVLRSFGFLIAAIVVVFLFLRMEIKDVYVGAILVVLVFIDMMGVATRYVNTEDAEKPNGQWEEMATYNYPYTAGQGEKDILNMEMAENPELKVKIDSALAAQEQRFKEEGDVSTREKILRKDYLTYRVMNRNTNFRVMEDGNPFNSSYVSYFNKSIGGYHGAKLSRYQDLIEFHLSRQNPAVINMLNTKYYIRPERNSLGQIANSRLVQVNRGAMGNAWFSKDIQIVEDANEEIQSMNSMTGFNLVNKGLGQVIVNGQPIQQSILTGREQVSILLPGMQEPQVIPNIPFSATSEQPLAAVIDSGQVRWLNDDIAPDSIFAKIFRISYGGVQGWDPGQTTIVDKRYQENLSTSSYSGNGSIELVDYHPDRMVYKTNSPDQQFAVFSEIYYEGGWTAKIDGNEVPVSRANYVLRALEVPAGEHTIEFTFTTGTYEKSGTYALIGSLLILAMILFGLFLETKRTEEGDAIDQDGIDESEDTAEGDEDIEAIASGS